MSIEQWEYSFMLAAGVFATLVGRGKINIGLPASNVKMMRWAGPLLLVSAAALLASTFLGFGVRVSPTPRP